MAETVILALAGLCALAYLPLTDKGQGAWRSVIKTVPLTLFALAAWLAGAPWLLVAGLALSALGDLALSREGEGAFLTGLCAFALAHVCYVALFVGNLQGWSWGALIALALLAISTEVWLSPHTGALRWPVRGYVGIICAMGVTAAGLPAGLQLAVLGAVLFMASDIILSVQLFRMTPGTAAARMAGYALWALYIAGQGAILLAFLRGAGLS